MSDLPAVGSLAHPVRLDPFQRIISVSWNVGGVVIIEVTAIQTKPYKINVLTPPDTVEFLDFIGGSTVVEDDYKEKYAARLNSSFNVDTIVAEDAIDVWRWDGFVIGEIDDPSNAAFVADGVATFGYSPPLHLVGQQVQLTQLNGVGAYTLGNWITYTHPNGHQVSIKQGYTGLTHGPAYDGSGNPFGDFDFSGTESWYWYRVNRVAERRVGINRQSYLVNFRSKFTKTAELYDFASVQDVPFIWSIKGYPTGTGFNTPEDQIVTPIGDVPPKFSASGSESAGHEGTIRKFSGKGFVS